LVLVLDKQVLNPSLVLDAYDIVTPLTAAFHWHRVFVISASFWMVVCSSQWLRF